MDAFVIKGGNTLSGSIEINGSKNACLPLMAATLLSDQPITLHHVPRLADISNMLSLLERLGCSVDEHDSAGARSITLMSEDESISLAPYDIVRTMRASVCVLGPMLAKRGEARVSMPGGCAIGDRPIDLHLRGLRALGAEISLEGGDVVARVPSSGRLKGNTIFLGGAFGPTVLGTANVMSAATLAEGTTIIEAAACEPEVVDVARLLNAMGARIEGAGTPRITIHGVDTLGGAEHRVIPDRIEAGTYVMAAAITGSRLRLTNYPADALIAAQDQFERMGVTVRPTDPPTTDPLRREVEISRSGPILPTTVSTQPHPGFPTDLQAQLMAMACIAEGNSVITERIYEQRFLHVAELSRMGANLLRQGSTVVVAGVPKLVGAPVMASDLRASASLVLAGLAAQGETIIRRVYHLDRGYEQMERQLRLLGARIERVDERELAPLV
ncbi:MAG: UDP-N-acetylglucosamine 1-carboxyvinyltransferase [Phycisphaerales bacterium JB050]